MLHVVRLAGFAIAITLIGATCISALAKRPHGSPMQVSILKVHTEPARSADAPSYAAIIPADASKAEHAMQRVSDF